MGRGLAAINILLRRFALERGVSARLSAYFNRCVRRKWCARVLSEMRIVSPRICSSICQTLSARCLRSNIRNAAVSQFVDTVHGCPILGAIAPVLWWLSAVDTESGRPQTPPVFFPLLSSPLSREDKETIREGNWRGFLSKFPFRIVSLSSMSLLLNQSSSHLAFPHRLVLIWRTALANVFVVGWRGGNNVGQISNCKPYVQPG